MPWESSGVVGFDIGPLLQGQTRIAKLKSAYNSLIIDPRGFGALSLRWIQFASVLRCARSSLYLILNNVKCILSCVFDSFAGLFRPNGITEYLIVSRFVSPSPPP